MFLALFLFPPFGNDIGKLWITAKIFLDKFAFRDNLHSASSGYLENRSNEHSANTVTSEIVSHEGVYQFKSAIGDCVVHESRFAVDDRLEALAAFVIGDFQHEHTLFPAYAQKDMTALSPYHFLTGIPCGFKFVRWPLSVPALGSITQFMRAGLPEARAAVSALARLFVSVA